MSWQTGNPPKSTCYLVTCQFPGRDEPAVSVAWYSVLEDNWMLLGGPAQPECPPVLAWQPLPEPYDPAQGFKIEGAVIESIRRLPSHGLYVKKATQATGPADLPAVKLDPYVPTDWQRELEAKEGPQG